MSDKTREEHQRQEPETVQQPETATGAAQEGQQPQWTEQELSENEREALQSALDTLSIPVKITDFPNLETLMGTISQTAAFMLRDSAYNAFVKANVDFAKEYGEFMEIVPGMDEYFKVLDKKEKAGQIPIRDYTQLLLLSENIAAILPYTADAAEAYKKETGKAELTFADFVECEIDPKTGEATDSLFERIFKRVQDEEEAKEKKKGENAGSFCLKELAPAPTGPALSFIQRTLNTGMRQMEGSKTNRHEHIKYEQAGKAMRITRENKRDKIVLTFNDAQSVLSGKNKGFSKIFYFTMQQMNNQFFPREVVIDLQEMVALKMYSRPDAARRAVINFFNQQLKMVISGEIYKKGRKEPERESGGVLFYNYQKQGSKIYLSVNENFNLEFLAQYFTVFPSFCYQLKSNAFSLTEYIFYLARQNAKAIKTNGSFTISFEAIRQHLGLPTIEEAGKNRHYQQDIVRPIEAAIEEVEDVIAKESREGNAVFTLTPIVSDNADIADWLNGRLEVRFESGFAKTFIEIADKQEKEISAYKKAKTKERARIDARQEAKGNA
ncbi:MAG: hypothetical protein LUE89_00355 [Clostridiales bacterium]|nr:hypothetical protein [Clostridiales bacterium]